MYLIIGKRKIILLTFLVLLLGWMSSTYTDAEDNTSDRFRLASAQLEQTQANLAAISMDFQDADLKDVLKILSQQAGLNFIASERVKDRKLTLYLDKVSVEDALNTLMEANNLTYELEKESKIFVVKEKELEKAELQTITKVFPLQYARVAGCKLTAEGAKRLESEKLNIKSVIENLLSEHGRIVEDPHTNSLIVTDLPSRFSVIEKTIEELDVKVLQVVIEAELIETDLDTVDKLGIAWGTTDDGELLTAYGASQSLKYPFTKDSSMPRVGPGGNVSGLYLGYVSANNLGGVLAMLKKDTDTRILARPKVLTLNGEEARIIIGERYPYTVQTTTETSTTQEVKFEDIGTALRVTPWVSQEGWITMYVHPEVSSLIAALDAGPRIATREAEAVVRVMDGETIVIAGLIKKDDSKISRKVPFLGNIPLLGNIFRKKSNTTEEKELIIFITPHLVKERQPQLQQKPQQMALEKQTFWDYEQMSRKEAEIKKALDNFEQ